MRLSEIIESLTHIETSHGDVEVTKVGRFENDEGCQVYVNYKQVESNRRVDSSAVKTM